MLDIVRISIQSWKWGDGATSARRESWVPFWGPAGGDGGKGGDIIFKASANEQTLIDFRNKSEIIADDGQDGMTKDRYGASAKHTILRVPLGTVIKDTLSWHILVQMLEHDQEVILVKWWKWWSGNIHFKNSINQYPNFSLLGEPGKRKELQLELHMLGDVGLIGTPSVGKSSLINTCCKTKAKTADYHFTTLEPNIGIAKVGTKSFSMVDIPGLIEGASEGKWLWNEFLRHILKARIFALVVDMDSYELGFEKLTIVFDEIVDYIKTRFIGSADFGDVIEKLELTISTYHQGVYLTALVERWGEQELLFEKKIQIVMNKVDMIDDEDIVHELKSSLSQYLCNYFKSTYDWKVDETILLENTFVVSAVTHQGIDQRMNALAASIDTDIVQTPYLFDTVVIDKKPMGVFATDITKTELPELIKGSYLQHDTKVKVWEIDDYDFSRLVTILPWWNDQAEYRFWKVVTKEKYRNRLEKAGVSYNDVLKVKSYYEGIDDKYIVYV